jgi:hypothetical protein
LYLSSNLFVTSTAGGSVPAGEAAHREVTNDEEFLHLRSTSRTDLVVKSLGGYYVLYRAIGESGKRNHDLCPCQDDSWLILHQKSIKHFLQSDRVIVNEQNLHGWIARAELYTPMDIAKFDFKWNGQRMRIGNFSVLVTSL